MKRDQVKISVFAAVGALLVLILDSRTAIEAAAEAVQVCIRTAIPSLFPFFVLSGLLVPYASKVRLPGLGRLLGITPGWESIFILGCVGGYPVGAQCVAQGYRSGKLDRGQAQRMLGFCTNCGPSFIFGIVGCAFAGFQAAVAIQVIHIVSALFVGSLWPGESEKGAAGSDMTPITLPQAVRQALRSMASVCAWIILGKVLLVFLNKWILGLLPENASLLVSGLLELTNGCLNLSQCGNDGIRFVMACVFVSFGGLCVTMQVAALCQEAELNWGSYLPQKAVQAGAAALLASLYIYIPFAPMVSLGVIGFGSALLLPLCKKAVEIPAYVVYNRANKGGM